jgi:hypothetical protein
MNEIFNSSCRESLSMMLAAKADEDKEQQRVNTLLRKGTGELERLSSFYT